MNKVLIAYDGSAQADEAVGELVHAGLPPSLEAVVLCVADVWMPPHPPEFDGNAWPNARGAYDQALAAVEQARALAENAAARLRQLFSQWTVHARSCGDSPPWAVVQQAKDWGADLVVVGGHSHSMFQRFFMGSVAAKVVAEAASSVRIARARPRVQHEGLRIMVAVDGSNDSVEAVRAAAGRTWPTDAEFRIVTVIDSKQETASAWPGVYPQSWVVEHVKGVQDWSCKMTDHMVEMLRQAGFRTESQIFNGDPKKELVQQAEQWEADCIFLGARGLHHGDRFYLGSLAGVVAGRAHCSVEIVRPSASR